LKDGDDDVQTERMHIPHFLYETSKASSVSLVAILLYTARW